MKKITLKDGAVFEPDTWLYVRAENEANARQFVGAPPNWPCKFEGFDHQVKSDKVFKVLATGLVIPKV